MLQSEALPHTEGDGLDGPRRSSRTSAPAARHRRLVQCSGHPPLCPPPPPSTRVLAIVRYFNFRRFWCLKFHIKKHLKSPKTPLQSEKTACQPQERGLSWGRREELHCGPRPRWGGRGARRVPGPAEPAPSWLCCKAPVNQQVPPLDAHRGPAHVKLGDGTEAPCRAACRMRDSAPGVMTIPEARQRTVGEQPPMNAWSLLPVWLGRRRSQGVL